MSSRNNTVSFGGRCDRGDFLPHGCHALIGHAGMFFFFLWSLASINRKTGFHRITRMAETNKTATKSSVSKVSSRVFFSIFAR